MKMDYDDDATLPSYKLIIRQQPLQSRMCGIGDKVDRRPIDPPLIVELQVLRHGVQVDNMNSCSDPQWSRMPNLYLTAVLIPCKKKRSPDLDVHVHSQLTVGRTVSSLYQFRDLDDIEKYFFVFSDLSIRAEGRYRFKLTLFEITGLEVQFRADIDTDEFTVYSAKKFPGMFGSCHLARSFARQGLKIRIRKASEPRKRRVRTTIDPIFQYQGVFNVHEQPPGHDDDDDDEIDDDDDERDGSSASSLDDDAPHDPPIPDTAHRPTNDSLTRIESAESGPSSISSLSSSIATEPSAATRAKFSRFVPFTKPPPRRSRSRPPAPHASSSMSTSPTSTGHAQPLSPSLLPGSVSPTSFSTMAEPHPPPSGAHFVTHASSHAPHAPPYPSISAPAASRGNTPLASGAGVKRVAADVPRMPKAIRHASFSSPSSSSTAAAAATATDPPHASSSSSPSSSSTSPWSHAMAAPPPRRTPSTSSSSSSSSATVPTLAMPKDQPHHLHHPSHHPHPRNLQSISPPISPQPTSSYHANTTAIVQPPTSQFQPAAASSSMSTASSSTHPLQHAAYAWHNPHASHPDHHHAPPHAPPNDDHHHAHTATPVSDAATPAPAPAPAPADAAGTRLPSFSEFVKQINYIGE